MADKNDLTIVTLDRPRMLWCGHKAMKMMESMLGCSITNIDTDKLGATEVGTVMYCLLQKDAETHSEVLTPEMVDDLLDEVPYGEVITAMSNAITAAFDTGKNAVRVASGTGKKH